MPVIEVEIGDDGKPVKVPGEVQKLIDASYGRGRNEATDEGQKKLKAEIERLQKEGNLSPAEKEQLKTLQAENSKFREDLALRDKNYEEAAKIREERYQQELRDRDGKLTAAQDEISKRTERLQKSAVKEALIAAAKEGARNESLPELEILLGGRIGLDDALQPFVRDVADAGKPALDKDGKPVSVEGFVKQYLTDHPHHKAAPGGRGGGGRGGRSTTGDGGARTDLDSAIDTVAAQPSYETATKAMAEILKKGA
jgi:hypothetical protein